MSAPLQAIGRQAPGLAATRERATGAWIHAFILFQIACQLALAFSEIATMRVLARGSVFAVSLALLTVILARRRRTRRHPAAAAAALVVVIVALSLLHPTTNGWLSGGVQAGLYVSILAPLFWVSHVEIDGAGFRRMMLLLWGFYAASAAVGVLQVYFPGSIQPNVSSVIAAREEGYLEGLRIQTASGETIFRPMGLTDIPGGAATGGFYALLIGMPFLLAARRVWMKCACLLGMTLGIMSIYLSQVRSLLVLAAICAAVFSGVLAWERRLVTAGGLVGVLASIALGGFVLASSIGGEAVADRLATLVQAPPGQVYYQSRGHFLESTIYELLPEYPLGAGLGRWGMANAYFGDDANQDATPIWTEIQWTGWLLDGGVPLILAYVAALTVALLAAWRIARGRVGRDLWLWGAVVFAYDVGALAITFNYPLFIGQGGLEFWLLNTTLFAAAETERRRERRG
jgi:hypothetical protein